MLYLTPTLISSWKYARRNDEKDGEFLNYLNRIPVPPTPAMEAGVEFENAVAALSKERLSWLKSQAEEAPAKEQGKYKAALHCVYGSWQVPIWGTVKLPSGTIGIKGKIDVLKSSRIIDLKRSSRYEPNKYADSLQHIMYMYCTGIKRFDYLIAYGTACDIAVETYHYTASYEEYMRQVMQSFISDMERRGLMEAYRNNWNMTDEAIEKWLQGE